MESVNSVMPRVLLVIALLGAASAAGARTADADHTGRAQLYACRFEQPGRGDRLLNRPARDPAVEACLARAGFRPAHAAAAR